jgi:hypothetical protein
VKSSCTRFLSLGILVCAAAWGQAQEQKPPEERTPPPGSSSRPTIQQPPPPPPRLPDVRQPGETGWWLGIGVGFPTQKPTFDKGAEAVFPQESNVQMQGKPKYAPAVELGLAVGLHNTLRFYYSDTRASGVIESIPTDLKLWDQTYEKGTYLATSYRLQQGKASFDFLTWPYPVESRRFRLKTLWQVQWTQIRTSFDAPKKPITDPSGFPLIDAAGNPISYVGIGSKWFVSPELGLGVAYYSGRHIRFEGNIAGFGWPQKWAIWDGDATINMRYGHFELRMGVKGGHFKTSPESEFYGKGTLAAPFVGLRWYSQ